MEIPSYLVNKPIPLCEFPVTN
ncbi:MAG: hypothetical protein RL016_103, partial [Actinomycetota bacterium]